MLLIDIQSKARQAEVSCQGVKCPSIQKAQEVEAPPPHPDQEEQLERERD